MTFEDHNAEAHSSSAIPTALETSALYLSREETLRAAANPALTEDLALGLLARPDLPNEVLEQLAKNAAVLKLRKAKMALVSHPHMPRHISVPLIRQFYTFDLMKIALTPSVSPDVKVAADDILISRLKSVTLGERLALARRGSTRIAGAMLLDGDARVMRIALENSRLTEVLVTQAVLRPEANVMFIQAVAQYAKWSFRREVRVALLRTQHLSLARALEFSKDFSVPLLRDVLHSSRLPARVKEVVLRECQSG